MADATPIYVNNPFGGGNDNNDRVIARLNGTTADAPVEDGKPPKAPKAPKAPATPPTWNSNK